MIVTTSQEYELINCGCCPYPQCPEPRKECQSIEIEACGNIMPQHGDVPQEKQCTRYRTKTEIEVRALHKSTEEEIYTNDETNTEVTEVKRVDGVCGPHYVSGSRSFAEMRKSPPTDPTVHHLFIEDTAAGADGVFTGTYTYTDYLDADNNSSGPSNNGVPLDFNPSGDWTYVGPATFKKVLTPATYETVTLTVTYSDPVTVTILKAELEALIADLAEGDPWGGSQCSSKYEGCENPTNLTKARYRFAVPEDYSTEDVPRSTYELQWDEVFFPTDPEAPVVFVASKSWTWGGSMEDPWSQWFEIPLPEASGETRVVNLRVVCYRSSRIGQKPTAHGEVQEIPN